MSIPAALSYLRPGASWSFDGTDYDGITWHDQAQTKPTRQEVDGAILTVQKASKWREIHNERERRRLTGGVFVAPYWFHSDEPSRSQYGDLLTMALEKSLLPTYVLRAVWKTMSGATKPMTVALLRQIRDAGFVTENAIYDNAEVHKAAMEASPTPLSYDYSTGWPVSFV